MPYLLSLGPHQLSAVEEIEKEELVRFSTHTCTEQLACGELVQLNSRRGRAVPSTEPRGAASPRGQGERGRGTDTAPQPCTDPRQPPPLPSRLPLAARPCRTLRPVPPRPPAPPAPRGPAAARRRPRPGRPAGSAGRRAPSRSRGRARAGCGAGGGGRRSAPAWARGAQTRRGRAAPPFIALTGRALPASRPPHTEPPGGTSTAPQPGRPASSLQPPPVLVPSPATSTEVRAGSQELGDGDSTASSSLNLS